MNKASKKKKGKNNRENPTNPKPVKDSVTVRTVRPNYTDSQAQAGPSRIGNTQAGPSFVRDLSPLRKKVNKSPSKRSPSPAKKSIAFSDLHPTSRKEHIVKKALSFREQSEGLSVVLDRKPATTYIPARMATFNFTVFNVTDYKKVLNKAEFLSNIQAFKYTGFDPLAVRTLIISKHGFSIDDVVTCTYLYLTRGTNLKKIMSHVSDAGKATINALVGKYNIISTIKGADSNAINLARFAACFPAAILTILTTLRPEDISRPVNLDALGKWTSEKFPPCFTCSGVAALVPKSPIRGLDDKGIQLIIELITFYSALETRVLDKTKKSSTLVELYNTALVTISPTIKKAILEDVPCVPYLTIGRDGPSEQSTGGTISLREISTLNENVCIYMDPPNYGKSTLVELLIDKCGLAVLDVVAFGFSETGAARSVIDRDVIGDGIGDAVEIDDIVDLAWNNGWGYDTIADELKNKIVTAHNKVISWTPADTKDPLKLDSIRKTIFVSMAEGYIEAELAEMGLKFQHVTAKQIAHLEGFDFRVTMVEEIDIDQDKEARQYMIKMYEQIKRIENPTTDALLQEIMEIVSTSGSSTSIVYADDVLQERLPMPQQVKKMVTVRMDERDISAPIFNRIDDFRSWNVVINHHERRIQNNRRHPRKVG
ncbi:hypothetical protein FQA39_LY18478 [Lamprigera yunnana]|nr:hypothetical protein FQA39_LY18478 [Lamprigera yunnana]